MTQIELEEQINRELQQESDYASLRFRFFTIKDKDEVMQLYRSMLGKEGVTWDMNYPDETLYEQDSSAEDVFGLQNEQGEIVATISIDRDDLVDALPLWSRVRDAQTGEVHPCGELARLAVREDYQNRGIARRMIQIGIEILKERGFVGMHYLVSEHNAKAVASYKKLAFDYKGRANLYEHDWLCYETLF